MPSLPANNKILEPPHLISRISPLWQRPHPHLQHPYHHHYSSSSDPRSPALHSPSALTAARFASLVMDRPNTAAPAIRHTPAALTAFLLEPEDFSRSSVGFFSLTVPFSSNVLLSQASGFLRSLQIPRFRTCLPLLFPKTIPYVLRFSCAPTASCRTTDPESFSSPSSSPGFLVHQTFCLQSAENFLIHILVFPRTERRRSSSSGVPCCISFSRARSIASTTPVFLFLFFFHSSPFLNPSLPDSALYTSRSANILPKERLNCNLRHYRSARSGTFAAQTV